MDLPKKMTNDATSSEARGADMAFISALKKVRTLRHPLEELPANHGDGAPEMEWDSDACRFVFVTDCKSLSEVVNGRTALLANDLALLFNRVTSNLCNKNTFGVAAGERH